MKHSLILTLLTSLIFSCTQNQGDNVVQIIATEVEVFGENHIDPYGSLHTLDEAQKATFVG